VQVLSDMVRRRPGLRLSLTIAKSDALHVAVQGGALDLAVAPSYPGLSFTCPALELGEDRVRVAARAGHPLLDRAQLELADLRDCSWVMSSREGASRRLVTQILEAAGLPPPRVTVEADYISGAVLGLVAATDLLVVAPATTLRDWFGRVNALPLAPLELRRTLVLLSREGASWSPLMQTFRELLLARQGITPPA
jgi:DNA-binding transcriptional LysR family regulator